MSWENGVDLSASTIPDGPPNVIVHLARTVHTPVGSASAGLVLFHPDADAAPQCFGFVCDNPVVGAYFGAHIFRDTPFESAPHLAATFEWDFETKGQVSAQVSIQGLVVKSTLSQLASAVLVSHEAGSPLPFAQAGIEAAAGKMSLEINGENIPIYPPGGSLTGGANAAWAPCGFYAR
jgi:hypothetical protein